MTIILQGVFLKVCSIPMCLNKIEIPTLKLLLRYRVFNLYKYVLFYSFMIVQNTL